MHHDLYQFIIYYRRTITPVAFSTRIMTGQLKSRDVLVAGGVGMTEFTKPSPSTDYPEMAILAIERALADANITYNRSNFLRLCVWRFNLRSTRRL